VTFLRLSRGHVIAAVAALVLLAVMAMDWYTTEEGEDARRTEQITGDPASGPQGDIDREVLESSSTLAELNEDNAWEASEAADRIVLLMLLATIALAIAAAARRSAGRSPAARRARLAPHRPDRARRSSRCGRAPTTARAPSGRSPRR
jgi:hypothetical protein